MARAAAQTARNIGDTVRAAFRGKITLVVSAEPVQRVQLSGLADETLQDLEQLQEFGFTSNPPAGNLRWLLLGNVLPIENNAARRGHQKLGQQIKASGFAGPVGPNQRMDGTAAHGQIHVADGGKAFELFGQARCLKNRVTHELKNRQCERAMLVTAGLHRIGTSA